jgi:hypothetical protein
MAAASRWRRDEEAEHNALIGKKCVVDKLMDGPVDNLMDNPVGLPTGCPQPAHELTHNE